MSAFDRTVWKVADLSPKHVGKVVRVPGLHQPGEDFGTPPVTVRGTLRGLHPHPGGMWLDARRTSSSAPLIDTPLPPSHPCFLVVEDQKAGEVATEVPLFGEGA